MDGLGIPGGFEATRTEHTTSLVYTAAMSADSIVYGDRWGEIIDRAEGYCEIRWFDTTAEIGGTEFNEFLSTFAGCVEKTGRTACLVDAVSFRMDMSKMDMGWRDQNIIPRYNKAGVTKFAFLMPAGMPAIGAEPQPEGSGEFPTGYFGTRVDAVTWLSS